MCLACSTKVEENMYVATLPYFPLVKQVYDIEKVRPQEQIMMQLYPEIYSCIGCNACTKACPQGLNVMQYIAYAQRGEFKKCAEESFDCVMCGICSSRCPAGISHPQVALLARRLNGKYIAPEAKHLTERVKAIEEGEFNALHRGHHAKADRRDQRALQPPRNREVRGLDQCILRTCSHPLRRWKPPALRASGWSRAA